MDIIEIREKAKKMGIEPIDMKKTELIRAIQRAEGNIDCYATEKGGTCGEQDCLWRDDCPKAWNEITQVESILHATVFIIRGLRNSASILSLIVENSVKMIKNDIFIKDSIEAIAEEAKRMRELIPFVESVIHPKANMNNE